MSDHTQPRFSVIVPACNVGPYIGEAIASIRRQTFGDFEAIITVEDSTDNTLDAARDACGDDPRLAIVTLPRSGSASQCRNYGIDHAQGQFLLFIDGDDWIDDDALQRFDGILQQHPDLDLIVSGFKFYRQNEDGSHTYFKEAIQGRPDTSYPTGIDFLLKIDFAHFWNPSTYMFIFRRELLTRLGYRQPHGRLHQDLDWSYRIVLKAGPVFIAPFSYYNYRVHHQSVTHIVSPHSAQSRAENAIDALRRFEEGRDFPPELRPQMARFYCWRFLHAPFLLRQCGPLATRLQEREDCRQALCSVFKRPGSFRLYCRLCLTAGELWPLMPPLMAIARFRLLFPITEYIFRICLNRILPLWRRLMGIRPPY